jgi:cell division septation protein DedD
LTENTAGRRVCAGKAALVFCFCLFLCGHCLYGQTAQAAAASLPAEIQIIEKKLASRLSPEDRNRTLRELARLLELSGSRESAARAWNEAALALPARDYEAFLRCAACLASAGEFENAAAAAQTAALCQDGKIRTEALYLGGQIEAFRSGNTSSLAALLGDPAFAPFRPGICYSIWKVSGDASYRARLLKEFPNSPEALILKDGNTVSAVPSALWLIGGFVPVIQPPVPGRPSAAEAPPAARDVSGRQGAPAETMPVMLQTGLFGREENARALADRLRGAGFVPVITPKTVNETQFWSVGVSPGQDHNHTILLLKDAGFEAFPVY